MNFIHSKKWIDDQYRPLVSDLGSSKFVDSGVTLTHMVGTPLYMAPEMYEEGKYTSKLIFIHFHTFYMKFLLEGQFFNEIFSQVH